MYFLKINFLSVSRFSVKDFLEKGEYENQEDF